MEILKIIVFTLAGAGVGCVLGLLIIAIDKKLADRNFRKNYAPIETDWRTHLWDNAREDGTEDVLEAFLRVAFIYYNAMRIRTSDRWGVYIVRNTKDGTYAMTGVSYNEAGKADDVASIYPSHKFLPDVVNDIIHFAQNGPE